MCLSPCILLKFFVQCLSKEAQVCTMDTEIKQNNGLEFLESKRACLAGLSIDFLYKKWHQNVTVGLYVLKQKKSTPFNPFCLLIYCCLLKKAELRLAIVVVRLWQPADHFILRLKGFRVHRQPLQSALFWLFLYGLNLKPIMALNQTVSEIFSNDFGELFYAF